MSAILVSIFKWFVTTRFGAIILAVSLAFGMFMTWHTIDKRVAIKDAVKGYVEEVEFSKIKGELAELKRRAQVTEQANTALQEQVDAANVKKLNLEKELQEYEQANPIDPDCRVTDDFINSLQ